MKQLFLPMLFSCLTALSSFGQKPENIKPGHYPEKSIEEAGEQDEHEENKSALEKMISDRCYPGNDKATFGRYAEEMVRYRKNALQKLPASWSYVDASGNLYDDVGRTSSITFDTLNAGRFYVCTPHSGVWVTNDNGITYTPITEDLPTQNTSSLVIDPSNTNILYLATGTFQMDMPRNSMGIYKSTDAGVTWNATGLTFSPSLGYAIGDLVINPQNTSSLIAATTDGLYRTFDGGTSWTKILNDTVTTVRFKPGDTTSIYTSYARYYVSSNSGASFTQVFNGIFTTYQYRYADFIRTSADFPNIVYLVTSGLAFPNFNPRLYVHKSTDSGLTFSIIDSLYGEYCEQFDVSQSTPDKMVMGYRSTFKKENTASPVIQLTQLTTGGAYPYIHADQRGISFDPRNDSIIYYCNDGGLYRTVDNGATFQNITGNMQLAHLYTFSNSQDTGYKILVSPLDVSPYVIGSNGIDKTYSQFVESFSSHVSPMNDSMFYLTHQTPFFTQDDGTNFYSSSSPLIGNSSYHVHNFQFSDCEENMSYYASYNDLFKSIDFGHSYNNFVHTPYNPPNSFMKEPQGIVICRANPDYIYVYYPDSVYVTTTGNSTFINITAGLPVSSAIISNLIVDPANERNVWVSFSGYSAGNKVFHSTDAGLNWTNISSGIPNVPVNVLACQHGITGAIYAGTDGGVFYIDSSFASWQYYNTGLPNVIITSLEIQYSIGKIRVATFGRGVWESDLFQPTPAFYVLPPVALFTSGSSHACPGENISFYDNSCGVVDSILWLFPGGSPASSTSPAPVVSYTTPGNYTITLIAYNVGGTDTLTRTNYITVASATSLPYYEPVSNLNQFILPAGAWTTDVNGDSMTWNRGWWFDGSSGPDDDFIYYDNFFTNLNGLEESLVFPPFNLSGMVHPKFYFYRSYARRDAITNDTLKVYAKSCGGTDTLVYLNGGAQLANAPGFYPTIYWQPSFPSDWVRDSVDLVSFAGQPYVTLSFTNRGYGGGLLYIDEFLFQETSTTGLSDIDNQRGISVYPNPAKEMIYIRSEGAILNTIFISDPLGRILLNIEPGKMFINLDISSLAKGIYFLHVNGGVRRIEKF